MARFTQMLSAIGLYVCMQGTVKGVKGGMMLMPPGSLYSPELINLPLPATVSGLLRKLSGSPAQ